MDLFFILFVLSWTVVSSYRPPDMSIPPYTSQGCWKDEIKRALPLLEGTSHHLEIHYKRRENKVTKCALAALEKGASTFAVQDGGQCFGSTSESYRKYGESALCEADGSGGPMANSVYKFDNCVTILVTSNGGPSSSGQQNLFKNKIFGVYHLSNIDSNGNAIYKKASAVSGLVADRDVHFHIFKGDIGWMIHYDVNSKAGFLATTECNDKTTLDKCDGRWKYYDNGWKNDKMLSVQCHHP